jgi:DNA segregation ATPase FtsK/SpoIIIE, S-DNA-T family
MNDNTIKLMPAPPTSIGKNEFVAKMKMLEKSFAEENIQLNNTNLNKLFSIKDDQKLKTLPDLFKIGNLVGRGLPMPCLFPFENFKGLAFELNDTNREECNLTLQHIALQFIQQLDPRVCNITLIDPLKMGNSFKFIKRLGKQYIDETVFDEETIRTATAKQFDKSVSVISECSTHFDSVSDYNLKSGAFQPFRFVFISDFPYGFRDSLDKLKTIIHNGNEAGIFFFLTYDTKIKVGSYQDKVEDIINDMMLLNEFGDPVNDHYKVKNSPNAKLYNDLFTIKLDRRDISPDNISNLISNFTPSNSDETDALGGVRIPIGRVAGQTHYFTLGHETDNFHGIIGGQSGKGKSVLLNNIIGKGIETYSSDELRFVLLDCAGTGFQEFKFSSHIQLLSSTSDVEQAFKVIQFIEQELKRREELFKTVGAADIIAYIKKSKSVLPRLIFIIDEFHVLFTGSSRTAQSIETILVEKVIKIGRKFGIHLLVCTQSLGGGVRPSILANIPLRIALGMTVEQSASFLGLRNEAAGNLLRGVAIYNGQNGNQNSNKIVQVNFLDEEAIEKIITSSNYRNQNSEQFETIII